jgi:hypothetical protein
VKNGTFLTPGTQESAVLGKGAAAPPRAFNSAPFSDKCLTGTLSAFATLIFRGRVAHESGSAQGVG